MERTFHPQPVGKTPENQPLPEKKQAKTSSTNADTPVHLSDEESPKEKVRKNCYSDKELQEFKKLIQQKLEVAHAEYAELKASITHSSNNGTDDTSPTFKVLEEGANVLSKEENGQLALRQFKFIQSLEAALVRIENKTYGVCCETGKLIPKERLVLVPHATKSVEGKKIEEEKKKEADRIQIAQNFSRSHTKKSGFFR